MDKDMLANELYLMDKGVRDCCETTVGGTPDELAEKLYDIEAMCLDYKYHVLSFLLEKEEDREYRSVFICKYNFQKILLTKLFNDIKPHSFEYEYMMGTLLGYSAASMEEFLMRKHTDEFASITEYNDEEKEEGTKVHIVNNNLLTDFDKDAWQVLLTLNSGGAPDSEKINTLTDLLYTNTGESREKNLVHNLAVAMPDTNKPDFSPCIRILERYFHVGTESEETDTPSVDAVKEKKIVDGLTELNKYYSRDSKEEPNIKQFSECAANLYLILDQELFSGGPQLDYVKKFIDVTPPQKFLELRLFVNIESIYYDESLSQEKKIEAIKNAIHRYLVSKKKVTEKLEAKEKKSDIVIDTIMNGSGDNKKKEYIKQYFGRAAELYAFLTVRSFPEEDELEHIKKFIEIIPPQSSPETRLHDNIESAYHHNLLSQEKKIEAVKHILHTYLVSKKNNK